jgi:hypothetical protein
LPRWTANKEFEQLVLAIFRAAGLPSARWRCDHFTTLATLTMNVLATERQDCPAATATTARFRWSKE